MTAQKKGEAEYALPEGVKKFLTGRGRPRSVFELNREQEAPKNVSRRSCDAKNETAFSPKAQLSWCCRLLG